MDSNMHFKQFECGFAMFVVDSDDETNDGWTANYAEMRKSQKEQEVDDGERCVSGEDRGEEVSGAQFMELDDKDVCLEKQVNCMYL